MVLDDIRAHIEQALAQSAIDELIADDVAVKVFNSMAKHWGGQLIYFPKGIALKVSNRNKQIWGDFRGNNYVELAKKYDLTVQRIYQIVAECRRIEATQRQGNLFNVAI